MPSLRRGQNTRATIFNALPLLAMAILAESLAHASSAPNVTFRSESTEVRMTFVVTDGSGRSVPDLRPNEFAIVDEEVVIRKFRSFSWLKTTETNLLILVDCSDSVIPGYAQEVAGVLEVISRSGSIAVNRVSVITFGGTEVTVLCRWNCSDSFLGGQLLDHRGSGATPLLDALVRATRFMQQDLSFEERPVLLVFSDGRDTVSMNSIEDAVESLLHLDAQVYGINVNGAWTEDRGWNALRSVIDATGGKLFEGHDGWRDALESLLRDLRNTYAVTYRLPSRVPGFHRIEILPAKTQRRLQFRCRRGYRVGGTMPSKGGL